MEEKKTKEEIDQQEFDQLLNDFINNELIGVPEIVDKLSDYAAAHAIDAEVRLYDRLFNVENPAAETERDFREMLNPDSLKVVTGVKVEPFVAKTAKQGTKFQFQRIGYFTPDYQSDANHLIFNRTIQLKDTWEKVAKKA